MYASQADAICDHIGCAGMGERLSALARALEVTTETLMPTPPLALHPVPLPDRGICLVLRYPAESAFEVADPDRWTISDVIFDAARWAGPLPFGLDAQRETPTTAQQKLGVDKTGLSQTAVRGGDRRQSFTLEDARIVELLWKPSLVGIDRIWVVRMGKPLETPPMLPRTEP